MSSPSSRQRRADDDLVGRAVVTGLLAGAPVAYLGLAAFAVSQARSEGAGLPVALRAALLTGEDWEVLPFWLLGAVLVGAVVGAVASAAWIAVHRRAPTRAWLANVAAAAVAAGLSALPAALTLRPLALGTSVLALTVALVAAPRVGLRRVPEVRSPGASPSGEGDLA